MAWYEWLPIALGIAGVITGTAAGVRFLVKHYFEEIKHELKPNSGSSMKDQVTRLEANQAEITKTQKEDTARFDHKLDKLETKIDKVFEIIIEKLGN
jgi:hypothetical protein